MEGEGSRQRRQWKREAAVIMREGSKECVGVVSERKKRRGDAYRFFCQA